MKKPKRRIPLPTPQRPAQPGPIPPPASLPASVTFFVSVTHRRAILDKLRTVHRDRAIALLTVLDLTKPGDTP